MKLLMERFVHCFDYPANKNSIEKFSNIILYFTIRFSNVFEIQMNTYLVKITNLSREKAGKSAKLLILSAGSSVDVINYLCRTYFNFPK